MAVFTVTRMLSALALAAVCVPAAASAVPASVESPVMVVSTSGLDAARPQDQAVLRHRIVVAVHKVCERVAPGDPMTSPAYAECFSRSMADAQTQLNRQIAIAASRAMVASATPR